MATVTKLKAAVNNKNLPILGSDGNLYNYYVGRWQNILAENGYIPSASEISAVNAFIENGINNGWIDKVKYLMPFIGSESAPITGMVPLIDNVAQYNLVEQTVDAKLFSYSGGKIACLGGRDDNSNINAQTPINTSQLGTTNCFSPFVCVTLDANTVTEGIKGVITFAKDVNNKSRYTIRKNTIFEYGMRVDASIETDYKSIIGSNITTPCTTGIFMARYYNDTTGRDEFKRYIILDGEDSPKNLDMIGNKSIEIPTTESPYNIFVGSNFSFSILVKVNVIAYMDVTTLGTNDMLAFNQAVFTLTTALGR